MKTNTFLLFFLGLFFMASCSDNQIEPNFLIQTTKDITIAYEAKSQATIHFTSSREWQANSAEDWFTISPSAGEGGTFDLVVTAKTENITTEPRTATITLTSGSLTQNITLQQSNAVTLEQSTYNLEAEGGALDIRFSTNVAADEFAVYTNKRDDWLVQRGETRTASLLMIRLKVLPNMEVASRTALYLFCKGDRCG